MLLSVVVPCYNEEAVLHETQERILQTLESLPDIHFELIFVDDGSSDRTFEILRDFHQKDARVKILRLSRNFGHQLAITAGIEHAKGDAVVVIDADLQDPPEVIPEMVEKWLQGHKVVYGKRSYRQGETKLKLWTAKYFYRLINSISAYEIPLDSGDYRLMDRKVVDALRAMPERDRFVRGMATWVGYKQTAVSFERKKRFAGETKYSVTKMIKFAADGILSFSTAPLRIATGMGFVASGIALLGIIYALVLRLFTNIWVTGWTALFIGILFMGGVQLICLGIIGEYIGRIYGEIKCRPLYLLEKKLGFDETRDAKQPEDGAS